MSPAADTFAPAPSLAGSFAITVDAATSVPSAAEFVGVPVGSVGAVPGDLASIATRSSARLQGRRRLDATSPVRRRRTAGASSASGRRTRRPRQPFATQVARSVVRPALANRSPSSSPTSAASLPRRRRQAIVEGVLLSRYTYDALRAEAKGKPITTLTLVAPEAKTAEVKAGAELRSRARRGDDARPRPGQHAAQPPERDEAGRTSPSSSVPERGLTVEVFDKDQLIEMGCGGLLGVNAGSVEPPRMIKLAYRPEGEATGHLAFVGKGIMYDSGGIALKPGDEVHAQMKNDMTGAAACFAAHVRARRGRVPRRRSRRGSCCTDNMPSGTAMALGDVITMRDGTTVEVINTDAEGRLVMADALALATEESTGRHRRHRHADRGVHARPGHRDGRRDGHQPGPRRSGQGGRRQRSTSRCGSCRSRSATATTSCRRSPTCGTWARAPTAGPSTPACSSPSSSATSPSPTSTSPARRRPRADRLWHTTGCSGFGARLLAQLATNFAVPRALMATEAVSACTPRRRRASPSGCSTVSSGWATRSPARRSCSST